MSEQIKKAKKSLARISDYQKVFGTVSGKKVLHDLMKTHGMMGSIFSENTHEMALKEGERNVVLRILSILKTDMNLLYSHIEEAERSAQDEGGLL